MYDLVIVGAGPAGLTAGIYSARYKLKTLIMAETIGGTALEAAMIENYPGFKFIRGAELMQKMAEQVTALGVQIKEAAVTRIIKEGNAFRIFAEDELFEAKSIILALGTKRRKLGIQNEDKFMGKGISYCVHCDAPMFRDKVVGVVGGRNAAVMAAMLVSEYATKVYVIYRGAKLQSEPMWTERAEKNSKIEIIYNANITQLRGDRFLESVKLDNGAELDLQGLFIEVGSTPTTVLAKDLGLALDEKGFIKVDENNATNVKGVFAAGDCTTGSAEFRQITTAVGEGTVAAFSAYKSLQVK